MDGFSFPPPPPPPPKASSSSQQDAPFQSNNRGNRGGRGGRGSFRSRGGPQQRGGRVSQFQNTNSTNNGNSGYGQNLASPQHSYGHLAGYQQQNQISPGSFVNPAFGGFQNQTYLQAPLPQTAAYAPGQSISQPPRNTFNINQSPGAKRTRDQAFGQSHKHPMRKPPSAPKAQVAPAVPSFGAPLLPQKPVDSFAPSNVSGRRQQPSPALGLIPQNYGSGESSDEEEEVDEEAAFGALQNGPLSFEFNGELASLSSPADIAEWIQERKKLWPSKRRIEEKEQEVQSRMNERKRIEQETRAAIATASGGEHQPVVKRETRPKPRQHQNPVFPNSQQQDTDSTLEEAQRELALQTQKVQELQKMLAEKQQIRSTGPNETAVETPLDSEQLQTRPAIMDVIGTSEVPKSLITGLAPSGTDEHLAEAAAALESSDNSSDSSESDNDSAPEEVSSKLDKPLRVPPPPQSKPRTKPNEPRQCISFASQGRCKFGDKCRFRHDGSNQSQGKRKTLYQRLVEQEMDEENKLALQAIRYLGSVGFFSKHASA